MTLTVKLLLVAALVLGIIIPFGYFLKGERSKKRYKRALGANVVFYFGAFAIAAIMLFSGDPVYAAETTAAASNATGFGYLAAALATGLTCVGGGIAGARISDNVDTLTGLRLAGVDGVVVHERNELREELENAMNDKEVGVILLTERFGREFPDLINEIKLQRTMPLLIEIPDRHGTGRKKDFITSYVNEAIGLKL